MTLPKKFQPIKDIFSDRSSFEKTERKLYSHDIGEVPSLIKPFLGETLAEAVVQPRHTDELEQLISWAQKSKTPLIARGKGTSGYGGVIPRKGGVVVDFYYLSKVLKVDKEQELVTVEPGITWEKLDKALYAHGLTLRLYPTSYMSSTVGGWLAQGGCGIGSYRYGYFKENVTSAAVILPDGSSKTLGPDNLHEVADAEGITGFITSITLSVKPWSEEESSALVFDNERKLQTFIEKLTASDAPINSLSYINPHMAHLKNLAPLREHLGHVVEKAVELPEHYILLLTYDKVHSLRISQYTEQFNGYREKLSNEIAEHEWQNRFKIMKIKRLGPDLIPAEVVLPLAKLADFAKKTTQKIHRTFAYEGTILKRDNGSHELVILGFIPADSRKFHFNFIYPLAVSVLKIAEKLGGRAYATGIYFGNKARQLFQAKHLENIRQIKKHLDHNNLFNPGKVIGTGLISTILTLAQWFEPLLRVFANLMPEKIGERIPEKPVRGIAQDLVWYAQACSQCGYCIDECDQFYGRGWESQTPRGKWYWLREYIDNQEELSQKMIDSFLVCTTCELCNLRCSANLPIEPSWLKMRGHLIHEEKKMTFPPFEMMNAATKGEGNIWAGYRKDRDKWFPDELRDKYIPRERRDTENPDQRGEEKKSKYVYFAGCTASYVEKDIGIASVRLLDHAGVDFTYLGEDENCCGTPMLVAGKWNTFRDIMKKNIEAVKATGADTVVTSCPACDMMWRQVYAQWAEKENIDFDIKTLHYSEIISEQIKSGDFTFPEGSGGESETVTWHDSCHIGRVSGVYKPPRDMIKAMPEVNLVEMASNHENAHCCGSVLTLIKEPDVAADIGEKRLQEAVDTGASKVLALCPCCEFQLRVTAEKKELDIEVKDLAHFAAEKLGYELPDPHPDVREQWAVFEKMIALMTPRGFAEIMVTMWPQLLDAMPLKMGKMMRFFGRIPGMMRLMKPMFPLLFPLFLPRMLPRVMPTMQERIAERVPMPDYMAEQMPTLLPQVMDNLLPHMVDDVVKLVSEPLVVYLTTR